MSRVTVMLSTALSLTSISLPEMEVVAWTGDTASARATLQHALDILNEIGLGRTRDEYPNADHIRALLARLAVIEDAS
jgi:hypothetical protein